MMVQVVFLILGLEIYLLIQLTNEQNWNLFWSWKDSEIMLAWCLVKHQDNFTYTSIHLLRRV
jgi:hypothetical protein